MTTPDQQPRGRIVLTGRDNDTLTCEEPTPIYERDGEAFPCVEGARSFSRTTRHQFVALSFSWVADEVAR